MLVCVYFPSTIRQEKLIMVVFIGNNENYES